MHHHNCVSGSALLAAAIVSTGARRGFHLMMRKSRAPSVFGLCTLYFLHQLQEAKPHLRARNKVYGSKAGLLNRKARSSVSPLGCRMPAHPGEGAKLTQAIPQIAQVHHRKRAGRPSTASVGSAHSSFLVPTVSIAKVKIEIDWGVATSQGAKSWPCCRCWCSRAILVQLTARSNQEAR